MEKFRILIVEDSVPYRKLLRDALQKSFPETAIEEATNGLEALQKVDAFLPNLIFMDVRLPDENGLEFTKKIKTTYPNIHIIILTHYDTVTKIIPVTILTKQMTNSTSSGLYHSK